MDQEILKKIFFCCGKESAWPLVSKFSYSFYQEFEFYRLQLDFPDYKNRTKNLFLKKKDNNPEYIHKLLSQYEKYNFQDSLQDRYIDLTTEESLRISDNSKVFVTKNDVSIILHEENLAVLPNGEKMYKLLEKYHVHVLKWNIFPTRFIVAPLFISSYSLLKNLKILEINSEISPFYHEHLEEITFTVPLDFGFHLPNLKKLKKGKCRCRYNDNCFDCRCDAIDISKTFPYSSKIITIDIGKFFLVSPLKHLQNITISYSTLTISDFSGVHAQSLTVISDFPQFDSYDTFVKICGKSNLHVDRVEKLKLFLGKSANILKFVDTAKIYKKIKLCFTYKYQGSDVSLSRVLLIADHTLNLSIRSPFIKKVGKMRSFQKPQLLKKLEFSFMDSIGTDKTTAVELALFDYMSKLTNLEVVKIKEFGISQGEHFFNRLQTLMSLRKIYFDWSTNVDIIQATKMLQLGRFCEIAVRISHPINQDMIDHFCLSLSKNSVQKLFFSVLIQSTSDLEMLKSIFQTLDKCGVIIGTTRCGIVLTPELEIGIEETKSFLGRLCREMHIHRMQNLF